MSKYYLIKYDDNYADEFDVTGHTILNQEEFVAFQEAIDKVSYMEFYFGTNEAIEYESPSDIRRAFTYMEISEEERKVLERLGLGSSGEADNFIENVMEQESWGNEDEVEWDDGGQW